MKENIEEKEMVGEKGVIGEGEAERLQDEERVHLQYVEMVTGNGTKLALTDISKKGVGEYRRRGSLCSDGPECLYAELLTIEERKVGDLEEKAEDLKEKLERSVDELAAVKEAHLKFVSEVRSIAETKRYWKSALQDLLGKKNGLEEVTCIGDGSGTIVDMSQDQDLYSFVNSPADNVVQGYLSPASIETTDQQEEEECIERSSEVEEMETLYMDGSGVHVHGEQQTAKVAVVDEEDVTREVHEEIADMVQADKLEPNELDSIEKQLESMGEGSPPLLVLDKELELEERSPAAPTLDRNRSRNQGTVECQLCAMEMVNNLQVLSEHLAKEHQIEVKHGKEDEEEVRSTNSVARKRGRPGGSGNKGKKLMRENSHDDDDGQDLL